VRDVGLKPRRRRIDDDARRARLAARHHLIDPAPSIPHLAGALCGLHSSDPSSVYLSAWARLGSDFLVNDLEVALYVDRSVARLLGMRRTMFVVPLDLAGVMNAACTRALIDGERRRLIKMIEEQSIAADGERWLAQVESDTLEALAARGEAVARELVADVPAMAEKLVFGEGKTWGGSVGMSTRVLFLLATAARIVRGRPRGRWTSSQYRWAGIDRWLARPFADLDPTAARAELARRYLGAFGPATPTDVKWWTGWTAAATRAALESIGAVEIDIDGGDGEPGLILPGDLDVPEPPGWVALLPGLDPTVMGWKRRAFYLDPAYVDQLFDRNGNAGPTVWVDGRIVGGWSQRRDTGEVVFELLEPVSARALSAIERRAAELTEWLGEVVVVPRFSAPLDRKLRG
jgi:hypothetical protein